MFDEEVVDFTDVSAENLFFCYSLVPYRDCDVVKNLKDSAGTYLKTICVVELLRNYLTAETFCSTNKMKLAVIDSNALKTSVVNFTNTKYASRSGGAFVEGKFDATCTYVSNILKPLNNYKILNTTCASSQFSYCEYRKPKGKLSQLQFFKY
jgi:hypothetical protein